MPGTSAHLPVPPLAWCILEDLRFRARGGLSYTPVRTTARIWGSRREKVIQVKAVPLPGAFSKVKEFVWTIYAFLRRLDGFGLLALGTLDSSFLFMPLGNDLLMIGMTASNHRKIAYYAVMATAGSVLGCLFIDLLSRKGGEKGLANRVPPKRLEYIKGKVTKRAGWALAGAALMPPPFPFTPFVAAAAALQYPRKRLLAVIAGARLVRFFVEGLLAIVFGKRILNLADSPVLNYTVLALVVISIAGSSFSIYRWAKRSENVAAAA